MVATLFIVPLPASQWSKSSLHWRAPSDSPNAPTRSIPNATWKIPALSAPARRLDRIVRKALDEVSLEEMAGPAIAV